jgi:nitrite reductase (NO-forming)
LLQRKNISRVRANILAVKGTPGVHSQGAREMFHLTRRFALAAASAMVLAAGVPGGASAEAAADTGVASIVRAPSDLPAPLARQQAEVVDVKLTTIEKVGRLADGASYRYWTFNGTVPGPFVRVRTGDTVRVTLENDSESWLPHNVDFHAVTGPHGGGHATEAMPGELRSFTFKALKPGLYVYHCATPMVAQHIANGMYGLILVEPEGGLPAVDREYYVMQGELYTAQAHGGSGLQEFSLEKLLAENPEHMMFNGSMDALTKIYHMESRVGDTVRIFFGVGGPNLTSSFHVIGEVFDRVYDQASLTSKPLTDVQTTLVPPGGATMVEFKTDYPGRYLLVDHALSRVEKGLAGFLTVQGKEDPAIFHSDEPVDPHSGH